MGSKHSTILKVISCLALVAICETVAISTTVGLFSTSKTIDTHLVIGSGLKAKLYLTELKRDELDDDGKIISKNVDLSTYVDDDGNSAYVDSLGAVDLSKYSKEILSYDKLVPTMTGKATFRLYNSGEIAFTYKVENIIKAFDASGNEDPNAKIKDQITWSLDCTPKELAKDQYADFSISYSFADREDNNDVFSQSVKIDTVVSVIQSTSQN